MVGARFGAGVAAAASLLASVVADVDPIVIKGSKFFYKTNGTEFFIKGIAYQTNVGGNGTTVGADIKFVDPLTDPSGCKRDIPNLQQLGTNAIRVYAIDPTKDHTQCMQLLQDAGIYLIADLSAPNISINRVDPKWDSALYSRYTSVVDILAPYSNTLGFFAGNEVSNNASNVAAIPFVKAAVRDMKAYIKQKKYRTIGVGYAADDDAQIRTPLRDYMNCGPSSDSIDFFGYNIYSWCGSSSFKESGYADRTQEFSNYNVPTFFAEYGCNNPEPRKFDETIALYSDQMTGVWSGGIVYEYFQEDNNYGLISLNGNSVSKLPDFTALSSQIAQVTPSGVNFASYTPTNTAARTCPPTGTAWAAATNLPPQPNDQLCNCMVQNLTCVAKPGIDTNTTVNIFSTACDPNNGNADICGGITHNGTTGKFGAYSMCNTTAQLSWALNAYYQQQLASNPGNTQACDFGGHATKQTPSSATNCGAIVSQAGGASGTTGGSGSTGGSTAAATSSGAAGIFTVPGFDMGLMKLGAYVIVAMLAGAGVVFW